jgi:small-conductance mechanosensitive channel
MLLGYTVSRMTFEFFVIEGYQATPVIGKVVLGIGVVLVVVAVYRKLIELIVTRSANKRRAHTSRNVLRLGFSLIIIVSILGIFTDQWLGVLFSLGILGIAVTFALQQPILSLIGWAYILVNQPYQVGDRVSI